MSYNPYEPRITIQPDNVNKSFWGERTSYHVDDLYEIHIARLAAIMTAEYMKAQRLLSGLRTIYYTQHKEPREKPRDWQHIDFTVLEEACMMHYGSDHGKAPLLMELDYWTAERETLMQELTKKEKTATERTLDFRIAHNHHPKRAGKRR